MGSACDANDVRCVSAACALGMVGVDGAAVDGADGIFHKARFVQGVGVNGYLDISGICDP